MFMTAASRSSKPTKHGPLIESAHFLNQHDIKRCTYSDLLGAFRLFKDKNSRWSFIRICYVMYACIWIWVSQGELNIVLFQNVLIHCIHCNAEGNQFKYKYTCKFQKQPSQSAEVTNYKFHGTKNPVIWVISSK